MRESKLLFFIWVLFLHIWDGRAYKHFVTIYGLSFSVFDLEFTLALICTGYWIWKKQSQFKMFEWVLIVSNAFAFAAMYCVTWFYVVTCPNVPITECDYFLIYASLLIITPIVSVSLMMYAVIYFFARWNKTNEVTRSQMPRM